MKLYKAVILTIAILGFFLALTAQTTNPIQTYAKDPTGNCPPRRIGNSVASGASFYCNPKDGKWAQYTTSAGSGTVSTFTVSSIVSWLTATVSNPTTTPDLAITATAKQTSHQVIGTCGTATSFGPCSLVAGDIPALTYLVPSNNLSDVTTPATARTNLGLGTAAVQSATSGSAVQKGNGTGGWVAALAADIISLFSTCSGTQYLGADGACHSAGSSSVPGANKDVIINDTGSFGVDTGLLTYDKVTGIFHAPKITTGNGIDPTLNDYLCGTAPATPAAGHVYSYCVSKVPTWKNEDGTVYDLSNMTKTIAHGTATLGTAAISNGACATVVSVSATGTLSTDVVDFSPNASLKTVTGYTPGGGLSIREYPTADTVNFEVCNETGSSVTPGSAVTLNWAVRR